MDRLDDLIRGSLHVAHPHPARLVDVSVVAEDGAVPGQGEEAEDGADGGGRVEDEILVLDPQTPAVQSAVQCSLSPPQFSLLAAHPGADLVHVGDDAVPALQAGPGVLVLVAGDGDVTTEQNVNKHTTPLHPLLPLDDGVDHGPAVPHDEDPLGAGEDPGEIFCVLQSQRVLNSSVNYSRCVIFNL